MMFISLFLRAQENFDDFDDFVSDIQEPKSMETMENMEAMENNEEPEEPAGFRLKNRTVELSIANIGIDASNNFIAAADIFKNPFYMLLHIKDIKQDPAFVYRDNIVIDIDEFLSGFKFNLNAVVKPFSFNFNRNDEWGFGLDIGKIDAMGNVFISGKMMRLEQAEGEKFGAGGAVFADVGVPVFFHVNEFKIKIRPAAYVPILYLEPDITYSSRDKEEGTYIEAVYNMRVYSLVDMDDDIMQGLNDNARDIPRNNLGYDFTLSVEYPWDYDLDVGVNIVNIPIPFAAAKLYYYAQLTGKATLDTSGIDLSDLGDQEIKDVLENAWDDTGKHEIEYGYDSDGKKIYRPFLVLFYLNYRPYDSRTLTLIPSLGFSLNWLYSKVFSYEGGISARFDFANIFIPVFGINYNDRRWKNSIDLAFNLRAFELDFGLSTQSQDFIKSFRGAGLGANFGIKLGW
jgi:hypothetical protein